MDDDSDDLNMMEDGDVGNDEQRDFMQEDHDRNSKDKGTDQSFTTKQTELQGGYKSKSMMHQTLVNLQVVNNDMQLDENVDVLVDEMSPEAVTDDDEHEAYEGDTHVHDPGNMRSVTQREMAAIPEANALSHKSKRRAESADEHSLDRAEWIKAACNLDFTAEKGNISMTHASFIHFSNENVVENLQYVGISLGNSSDQITSLVEWIKEVEIERIVLARSNDIISDVFDKEEKEELDNEEVDKLILNSLCCDIMDEVMDLGNVYPKDCNITPRQQTSSSSKKVKKTRRKAKKSVQNERHILE
jgi:hypothetical protein